MVWLQADFFRPCFALVYRVSLSASLIRLFCRLSCWPSLPQSISALLQNVEGLSPLKFSFWGGGTTAPLPPLLCRLWYLLSPKLAVCSIFFKTKQNKTKQNKTKQNKTKNKQTNKQTKYKTKMPDAKLEQVGAHLYGPKTILPLR